MKEQTIKIGDLVENISNPELDYRRVNHVSEDGKQISLELLIPGLTGPFLAKNYRVVTK